MRRGEPPNQPAAYHFVPLNYLSKLVTRIRRVYVQAPGSPYRSNGMRHGPLTAIEPLPSSATYGARDAQPVRGGHRSELVIDSLGRSAPQLECRIDISDRCGMARMRHTRRASQLRHAQQQPGLGPSIALGRFRPAAYELRTGTSAVRSH